MVKNIMVMIESIQADVSFQREAINKLVAGKRNHLAKSQGESVDSLTQHRKKSNQEEQRHHTQRIS